MSPEDALMVLAALPDFGPIRIRRLLSAFGDDPIAPFTASESRLAAVIGHRRAAILQRWERHFDLPREHALLERHQARFITCRESEYPESLGTLEDSPTGLYAKGPLALAGRTCLAVVGTRNPTTYGMRVTRMFVRDLVQMGFVIVSGLARGIDTVAHETALECGGDTVAVIGNGIDIVYPRENAPLFRKVAEQGLLLSEFYFGRRADRQTFPQRNRIVSGLSRGVLIIESDEKGGSLITARFAMEQGRSVFAIPGRVDNPLARGCHRLIRDGAALVENVSDITDELGRFDQIDFAQLSEPVTDRAVSLQERLARFAGLSTDDTRMVEQISELQEVHPDTLVEAMEIAPARVHAMLLGLELKGIVEKRANGQFSLRI